MKSEKEKALLLFLTRSIHILVGLGIQDIMNKHGQYFLPLSPPENKFRVFNSEVRNSTE